MVRSRLGHRRAMALTVLASAAVLVVGCGQPAPSGRTRTGTGQLLVGRAEPLPRAALSPTQLTAAEDDFGLLLFRRLCAPAPDANLLLSPESAADALGMLYAGAKGPTAAALRRLLRLPTWHPGLVAALSQHTAQLSGLTQLDISDHLFEQSGVRPSQQVLDDLRTAYRAGLWTVDFGKEPGTTNQINGSSRRTRMTWCPPSSRRRCPRPPGPCWPTRST